MIDLWFPVAVYYTYLDKVSFDSSKYVARTEELKIEYPEVESNWRCTTYATLYATDIRDDEVFKPLIAECKNHVAALANKLSAVYEEIECIDAWVNVAGYKDFQEAHIHPNSHFSAVFYIKTPINCGRIVFKSPDDMFPLTVHTHDQLSSKTCHYEPEENKLIIFRANTSHMVEANMSDDTRMSVVMNFRLKGNSYD